MEAEMTNVNPLMDFARKVECSVKLPSQGLLYDEDMIEFNSIGEVNVMPMLPNDELSIVNPESLISGDAIIGLIKSCCPGIKNPGELFYPDVNALLLAIRKATYGNSLIQSGICPKCWEKKDEIESKEFEKLARERGLEPDDISEEEGKELFEIARKNVEKEITEKETNNEIKITPIEYKFDIDAILQTMTMLPKETFIETKEGLKIYLTPYRCQDKILFTQRNINEQKVLSFYKKSLKNEKLDEENMMDFVNKSKQVVGMYSDITYKTIDIMAKSISKVVMPNGQIVDNFEYIREYIKNVSSELIIRMHNEITKLNEYGIKQTLNMKCPCCGHEWEEKFYGFNQSDFFGIGS